MVDPRGLSTPKRFGRGVRSPAVSFCRSRFPQEFCRFPNCSPKRLADSQECLLRFVAKAITPRDFTGTLGRVLAGRVGEPMHDLITGSISPGNVNPSTSQLRPLGQAEAPVVRNKPPVNTLNRPKQLLIQLSSKQFS